MAVEYLGHGTDDGVVFGRNASDKIAFFNATPISQKAAATAPTSTAAVSISASQWGFSSSTQANAITTLVLQLRADLVTYGLFS